MCNCGCLEKKELIDQLSKCRGADECSLVTLTIPPGTDISDEIKMLNDKYESMKLVKYRASTLRRTILLDMIDKLKTYDKVPDHGLVILAGIVYTPERDEFVIHCIEPFVPIREELLIYDNIFYVDVFNINFKILEH